MKIRTESGLLCHLTPKYDIDLWVTYLILPCNTLSLHGKYVHNVLFFQKYFNIKRGYKPYKVYFNVLQMQTGESIFWFLNPKCDVDLSVTDLGLVLYNKPSSHDQQGVPKYFKVLLNKQQIQTWHLNDKPWPCTRHTVTVGKQVYRIIYCPFRHKEDIVWTNPDGCTTAWTYTEPPKGATKSSSLQEGSSKINSFS